jgi:hypothetical protein
MTSLEQPYKFISLSTRLTTSYSLKQDGSETIIVIVKSFYEQENKVSFNVYEYEVNEPYRELPAEEAAKFVKLLLTKTTVQQEPSSTEPPT